MATEDSVSLRVASFSCYLDTAKENLVQRISDKDTKSPFISTNSLDSITSLRVDSFSHNLNAAGENFVFKFPRPIVDPDLAFNFPQETPSPIKLGRTKHRDEEIDVFGADKYFNVKLDRKIRAEPPAGSRNPSIRSEESSWNSQSAFLQNTCSMSSQAKQKMSFGRRFVASLGCLGICFNKKSVQINELVVPGTMFESKHTPIGTEEADHFAFQIPNLGTESLTVDEELKEEKSDKPRRSLEVFGSSSSSMKGVLAKNMERKLSMLTWDAIPKPGQNLTISALGNTTICDDMASDASSDLFEIENISGTMYPYKLKVESDQDLSLSRFSPSPTTQYAPSETSIEWSVITASAADYSSVISDYEEKKESVAGDRIFRNGTFSTSKTGSTGGLMGFKN